MKKPVHVEVEARTRYKDENERLIKKFSRKVKKSGILELVRERRYYVKKSTKRRLKKLKKLRLSRESTKKNQSK